MATISPIEPSSDPLDPSKWTSPQELCLLQALTRWKPVGLHKHFRMRNILTTILKSGTIPQPVSDYPHCSTSKGIWAKLNSLYDLKTLDENEDAIFADIPADDDDKAGIEYWREFELGGDDLEQQMWDRRLADGAEEWSDEEMKDSRVRESTVGDSEDPRSSPVGSARGTRSSGRRAAGRRLAEVKQEDSMTGGASGKGSRRTSKAASPSVKGEEDTEMQDADQDDEGDSSDGDESDQDETEDDSRKGRPTRGRGGRRGRVRRGRRGK